MSEKPFLQGKYPDLPRSSEVKSAVRRQEARTDERVKGDSASQIEAYLNRLQEIFDTPDPTQREKRIGILKDKLYDSFVIKPEEVPEAYFDLQKRIARERGQGDVNITDKMRQEMIGTIITDQTKSLDAWVDYLGSNDAPYPTWFKYFAFRSITQLAEYDKEKKQFRNRSKGTTSIFPDINREALAYVADELIKKQKKEPSNITDAEWQKLFQSENFAKMYAYAIEKITPASQEQKEVIEGQWVKYDQDTEGISGRRLELSRSLQGHGTGWCTAGESTAEAQLKTGDFYVYYSRDQQQGYTIPRIAIRMQGGQIAEVRGIAERQNLEGNMTAAAEEKIATLPGAEKYKKRTGDMKRMTEIENKVKQNQTLTKEDLRFLYEIDSKVEGFGYDRDPRINEILKIRPDKRTDLAFVFDTTPDKVSLTIEEALSGGMKVHFGNLYTKNDFYIYQLSENKRLPEYVIGLLELNELKFDDSKTQGAELPKHVCGNLSLAGLTLTEKQERLKLPEYVGGDLDLQNLTSAEGIELPKYIGGNLDLQNLKSIVGLKLPEYVGGNLYLRDIPSAKGLKLPKHVGGTLHLFSLTSAEGVEWPEYVGDSIDSQRLEVLQEFKLPEGTRFVRFPNLASEYRERLKKEYPNLRVFPTDEKGK